MTLDILGSLVSSFLCFMQHLKRGEGSLNVSTKVNNTSVKVKDINRINRLNSVVHLTLVT